MEPPTIVRGLLGWSNKRSGLEFYRYDPRTIPRHSSEWGDLLVQIISDGMGYAPEGSPVVVIVLPRSASEKDVWRVEAAVSLALEE